MRGRQNWGQFFGSSPLNTEVRDNILGLRTQKNRIKILRDLRGRQNWEDFSVQLSKYRDQRELKRLKGKSSLKSPGYRNPPRFARPSELGRFFGSSPLTQRSEKIYKV